MPRLDRSQERLARGRNPRQVARNACPALRSTGDPLIHRALPNVTRAVKSKPERAPARFHHGVRIRSPVRTHCLVRPADLAPRDALCRRARARPGGLIVGTLFALLIGMLVVGAGVALGIMAHDRASERGALPARCSADD
jgi:hypothetical protein